MNDFAVVASKSLSSSPWFWFVAAITVRSKSSLKNLTFAESKISSFLSCVSISFIAEYGSALKEAIPAASVAYAAALDKSD